MDTNTQPAAAVRRLVSTGFTALDVIVSTPPRVAAGGTAGNVAAAAAAMGWQAEAVGTVGDDPAGRFLRDDLARAGVDVDGLRLDAAWTTPVVLQEQAADDHVWRFFCPRCGTRFARHRPTPAAAAAAAAIAPRPDVFFFDRPSLFALALAESWRERGALTVFEPSGLGRPQLFSRAVAVADLVKYSAHRAPALAGAADAGPGAVVRTDGAAGAAFRPAGHTRWTSIPAPRADHVVDTAGAGDWTTAGLLTSLFDRARGTAPSDALRSRELLAACLDDGQAWGARACGWQGARPPADGPVLRTEAVPALYCTSV